MSLEVGNLVRQSHWKSERNWMFALWNQSCAPELRHGSLTCSPAAAGIVKVYLCHSCPLWQGGLSHRVQDKSE